ncbi:hypothetical protein SADUNF_Sadunf15G0043700 [Salix dunnii]|uniref:NmrA-like domain-containing protein n=1 Tax=Salix dunnii TaxID=1413687 RepID=A0A835JDZ0_9ROSI|nr:hypothetical protein SADUNF_Sadunf15G0043700 [Salix dunnii]
MVPLPFPRQMIHQPSIIALPYMLVIRKFTVKSIDDNRTLNKTVHFRPPRNLLSTNELASLWEEKLGYKLLRVAITKDDLLPAARGWF